MRENGENVGGGAPPSPSWGEKLKKKAQNGRMRGFFLKLPHTHLGGGRRVEKRRKKKALKTRKKKNSDKKATPRKGEGNWGGEKKINLYLKKQQKKTTKEKEEREALGGRMKEMKGRIEKELNRRGKEGWNEKMGWKNGKGEDGKGKRGKNRH